MKFGLAASSPSRFFSDSFSEIPPRFDATKNQNTLDDIKRLASNSHQDYSISTRKNPSKPLFALESWAGGVDPKRIPSCSTKKTLKATNGNVGNFQL